jgi:hypothetical protein
MELGFQIDLSVFSRIRGSWLRFQLKKRILEKTDKSTDHLKVDDINPLTLFPLNSKAEFDPLRILPPEENISPRHCH